MKKFRRFRMLPVLLSILICLVFLVGCGAGASEKDSVGGAHVTLHSTERALLPVFTGQLAIVKQGDLWVLEGGKEPLRLTSDGCNCCPAWSPDGKWLLFYKYDPAEKWNRDYSLWVACADGMGVYSIDPETQILDARWSPAANSIAYLTARQDERQRSTNFKLVQVSGEGPCGPLPLKDESEKIMNICWFPTGEKLVYTTAEPNPNAKDNPTVKVMPAGGGDAEILLSVEKDYLPDTDPCPALSSYLGGLKFSPNKDDLSFFKYPFSASLTADGVYLYAVSAEKQEPSRLATMLAYPYWVDWSPGGDLLALIEGSGREAFSNKRLSIMPVNSPEKAVTITPDGYVDRDPAWSPDGKHIAVSRAKSKSLMEVSKIEDIPPASIWLVSPDGSGAKQICSDGEIPGCFDYNPWWAEGGKSLMWVRVENEKASIRRTGPDGGDHVLVCEDLDIPQGYYGAYNWEEVMAWRPGALHHPLPFPAGQAGEIRSIGDDYILIEKVYSLSEHDYYLDHPFFDKTRHIVGFIETAKFNEYIDGELIFNARGGSDTGNFQFPYRLIYNTGTEGLRSEDLFLPLNEQEQVSFGKKVSWKRILTKFQIEEPDINFDFKPAPGAVLAGGRSFPHTTVQYNEKLNELIFTFFNVELADTFQENKLYQSPGLRYAKEFRFEQLSGCSGDNQSGPQTPMVRVRIALEGQPLYNARTTHFGETINEETARCTVRFR